MHTLTVSHPLPGSSRDTAGPRTVVLVVVLAAAAGGVHAGRPSLVLPRDGVTSSFTGTTGVLHPAACRAGLATMPAVAALDASLTCRDLALAGRARALELDPIR